MTGIRIGVTMGDPAGIGPEIVVKSLAQPDLYEACIPIVIGSREPLEEAMRVWGLELPVRALSAPEEASAESGAIQLLEQPLAHDFHDKGLLEQNGRAALAYLRAGALLAGEKRLDGLATAPTNKEAMHAAGLRCAGATELLAEMADAGAFSTVIAQGGCYILQMTTHLPLREAIRRITEDGIYRYALQVNGALQSLGLEIPKIGISGLNPHAGDGGVLGEEEQAVFIPAIRRLREEGVSISDPQPCDTLFNRGIKGEFDALIFLFHDTANTAVKTAAAAYPPVVITAGLPYVRSTVAHGTAYDIAYQGLADWRQFYEAIRTAARVCAMKRKDSGR